jgi:hypothetical protein
MRTLALLSALVAFVAIPALAADDDAAFKPDLSGDDPHWVQDRRSKCWAGTPDPMPGLSMQWSGDCVNGLVSGLGQLTWYVNGQMVGRESTNFKDGIPWGHGRIHQGNGQMYEGDFPGKGTLTVQGGGNVPAEAIRVPGGWHIQPLPAQ